MDLRRLWRLATAGILGAVAGTLLLAALNTPTLKLLIGVLIVVCAAGLLTGVRVPLAREERAHVPVGLTSGVLQGCTGMGGPPMVLLLVNQDASKTRTRADLTVIFALVSVAAVVSQFTHGLITREVLRYTVWMTPVTIGGTLLGAKWADRCDPVVFRRIVLILILATGAATVVTAIQRPLANPRSPHERLAIDGGLPMITDPVPQPARWGEAERRQLAAAIDQPSLFYWNGPQTKLLTERFREAYPFQYVMPCSSGTAALHIAVAAAGLKPGDEVITSPITDMGTVIGILYQQGVPVFADLEPHRYTLDIADVRRKITPRTRAILAVHLAGNPSRLAELRELADQHDLVLIEDCAQAWGAQYRQKPVGMLGHLGCYSLNDFKHIGCGDGGIVASNDERFGPLLQRFGDKRYDRATGMRDPEFLAPNYRISELQSAVAVVQLTRLEEIAAKRARLGGLLTEQLAGIDAVQPHEVDSRYRCSYWFYLLRLKLDALTCDRKTFVKALQAEGVPVSEGYIAAPLYRYPVFQNRSFFASQWPVHALGLTKMDYRQARCEEAEAILATSVRVSLNEAMDESYVRKMAEAIRMVAEHYA